MLIVVDWNGPLLSHFGALPLRASLGLITTINFFARPLISCGHDLLQSQSNRLRRALAERDDAGGQTLEQTAVNCCDFALQFELMQQSCVPSEGSARNAKSIASRSRARFSSPADS